VIRAALLAVALAAPAGAGTLEGRAVSFTVAAWDDPAQPYLEPPGPTVVVGDGIEFDFAPEGVFSGLSVVPIRVEIGPARVEITYPMAMGHFYESAFNGYVLRFETECALFSGWSVDREFTTLPLTDEDIFTDRGALFINVAGMGFGPDQRLAVDLDVMDCPLS
jgi:hypothetical protein